MTSSPDAARHHRSIPIEPLPPALSSMWRLCSLGYRHEPRLMVVGFRPGAAGGAPGRAPRALVDAARQRRRRASTLLVSCAAIGLGVSATATWFLRTVSTRVQRRFRDKVTIALESHVAGSRRPSRRSRTRSGPSTRSARDAAQSGVRARPHVHVAVLNGRVDPAAWRDDRTARVDSSRAGAAGRLCDSDGDHVDLATRCRTHGAGARRAVARLARHLFTIATTASPGKEVRVTGIGRSAVGRRAAWQRWYALVVGGPKGNRVVAHARVGDVRRRVCRGGGVCRDCAPRVGGRVLLVLAAGARLSAYIGATVGEIGFLRGFWMDGVAASRVVGGLRGVVCRVGDQHAPSALRKGIRLDDVSFAYPGTDRARARRRVRCYCLRAPSWPSSVRTAQARPRSSNSWRRCTSRPPGRIVVDDTPLARIAAGEWRARLAGAFQDFFRFEFRARHTVGVGDVPRLDNETGGRSAVVARRRGRCREAVEGRPGYAARADVA